jgi:cytochrome c oxidase cbb3-type subunit 4
MNVDYETTRAIVTVVLLIVFLAIIAWAWSGKRRNRFEEAAQLPLEEELKLTDSWQHQERRK